MKKKISLLVAGTALAFMACSSLEVNNPIEENFPSDWNVEVYANLNPDLKALQYTDQIAIMNKQSGAADDMDAFVANEAMLSEIAVKYAGFTATNWDPAAKDKMDFIKKFNINGVTNENEVIPTIKLDMEALSEQYLAYGMRDGRPYRECREGEATVIKQQCQAADTNVVTAGTGASKVTVFYYHYEHLYCAQGGEVYCIDCEAEDATCKDPAAALPPESSSSVTAAPTSSSSDADSAPESSAGGDPAPESSADGDPAPESSSAVESTPESSADAEPAVGA